MEKVPFVSNSHTVVGDIHEKVRKHMVILTLRSEIPNLLQWWDSGNANTPYWAAREGDECP